MPLDEIYEACLQPLRLFVVATEGGNRLKLATTGTDETEEVIHRSPQLASWDRAGLQAKVGG